MSKNAHDLLLKASEAIFTGKSKASLRHAKELFSRGKQGTSEWLQASFIISSYHFQRKDYQKCLNVLKRTDDVMRRTGKYHETEVLVMHFSALSNCYFFLGDFESALSNGLRGLELDESTGSPQFTFDLMHLSIKSLRHLKRLEEIPEVIKKSITILHSIESESKHRVLFATELLADIYNELGREQESIEIKKDFFSRKVKTFMTGKTKEPPKLPDLGAWGTDDFTFFFALAHNNTFAFEQNFPTIFESLAEIHAKFSVGREFIQLHFGNWIRDNCPSDIDLSTFQMPQAEQMDVFFWSRSHASFLSATRLAISGQTVDAYSCMRGAIESALYAVHGRNNPADKQIWLDRKPDKKSRSATANVFHAGNIIKNELTEPVKSRVKEFYELVIDEGAHPNVAAFYSSTNQRNDPGQMVLEHYYLNEQTEIEKAALHCIEAGEISLLLFRELFNSWIW